MRRLASDDRGRRRSVSHRCYGNYRNDLRWPAIFGRHGDPTARRGGLGLTAASSWTMRPWDLAGRGSAR